MTEQLFLVTVRHPRHLAMTLAAFSEGSIHFGGSARMIAVNIAPASALFLLSAEQRVGLRELEQVAGDLDVRIVALDLTVLRSEHLEERFCAPPEVMAKIRRMGRLVGKRGPSAPTEVMAQARRVGLRVGKKRLRVSQRLADRLLDRVGQRGVHGLFLSERRMLDRFAAQLSGEQVTNSRQPCGR